MSTCKLSNGNVGPLENPGTILWELMEVQTGCYVSLIWSAFICAAKLGYQFVLGTGLF